jgi:hypothetical protein
LPSPGEDHGDELTAHKVWTALRQSSRSKTYKLDMEAEDVEPMKGPE